VRTIESVVVVGGGRGSQGDKNREKRRDTRERKRDPQRSVKRGLSFQRAYISRFDKMVQISQVCFHTGQFDGLGIVAKSAFFNVCEARGKKVRTNLRVGMRVCVCVCVCACVCVNVCGYMS
jgi:hypothetical protein